MTLRRSRISVALGAAVGLSLLASPAMADPAAVQRDPDPTKPDMVIAQADDGMRYHFPGATELADGTILVVAREGVTHSDPTGRIELVRSTDGGATWSAPQTIWDSNGDDRDPKISVTSSGRIFVNWFTSKVAGSPADVNEGTFVMHSDDGGLTWSQPTEVGTSLAWIAEHGEVTQMPDGSILAPVYGPGHSGYVRSTDGGETFPVSNEYYFDTNGVATNEVTLTVLPSGQVTAWLRPATEGNNSLLMRSFDSGHTWLPAEVSTLKQSSADTIVLPGGKVLAAYGDKSARYGVRRITSAALIDDPSQPWSPAVTIPIYDNFTNDQANPALVRLNGNRVLVVGFSYSDRQIVGTVVSLNDFKTAPTDDKQLKNSLDIAGMVANGQATIDTDLQATTAPSLTGPIGAVDGKLGLANAAVGTASQNKQGYYTINFAKPIKVKEVGVALRPGENQDATIQVQDASGAWTTVGHLDYAWRYGDVDWVKLAKPQTVKAIKVTSTTSPAVRPPNSGVAPAVAISEIAVR